MARSSGRREYSVGQMMKFKSTVNLLQCLQRLAAAERITKAGLEQELVRVQSRLFELSADPQPRRRRRRS